MGSKSPSKQKAQEEEILKERAHRREFLRQVFLKEKSNPFAHLTGEGGHVFDPAILRYHAMKENGYEYFKPNLKNALMGLFGLVVPITIYYFVVYTQKNNREQKLRRGEVAYKDRSFKFM